VYLIPKSIEIVENTERETEREREKYDLYATEC
jgi:hypothetical protein